MDSPARVFTPELPRVHSASVFITLLKDYQQKTEACVLGALYFRFSHV